MSTRKNPQTSLDAWKQVHPDMLNEHHAKILEALTKGSASAEQLAARINLTHAQVNRRISELARKQLIFNTNLRVATSTGRAAFVWALTKPNEIPQKATESVMPGKTISDYSKSMFIQPNLF